MLFSFLAAAQFPNLPYNPDENSDGLIGVVDLQGLLANYGSEFSSAVLSEDGESAVVYMGEMTYPHCKANCDQLPGFWSMPKMEELIPVWSEVYTTNTSRTTWLDTPPSENSFRYFYSPPNTGSTNHRVYNEVYPVRNYRCYCAAKQLPRVEYATCEGSNIQECCTSKVAEGWYPLGNPSSAPQNNSPYYRWNQSFWRWAE